MAKPALRKRPKTAIRRVNKALESSVIDVLRELIPEVKALPRKGALEAILDDLGLLARCFMAYREDPESFRHLLVNKDKEHVLTSDQIMVCGRSFDDVVSMVVSTSAKRYFRLKLDGRTRALQGSSRYLSETEMSAVQRMLAVFGKKYERDNAMTKGRELYDAIQDYLHFDWQVPLVPEYAAMAPEVVTKFGPKLLDYKVSSEIQALTSDPDNPPPPSTLKPRPLFVPPQSQANAEVKHISVDEVDARAASISGNERKGGMAAIGETELASAESDRRARMEDILTGDGRRLKAAAFSMMLLDPKIRAALPDANAAVRVSAILGLVGGNAAKVIVGGLGLRADQLAVLLIGAHHTLGEDAFIQLFGVSGRLDGINRLVEQARTEAIDQNTPLDKIAELARRGFAAVAQAPAPK